MVAVVACWLTAPEVVVVAFVAVVVVVKEVEMTLFGGAQKNDAVHRVTVHFVAKVAPKKSGER